MVASSSKSGATQLTDSLHQLAVQPLGCPWIACLEHGQAGLNARDHVRPATRADIEKSRRPQRMAARAVRLACRRWALAIARSAPPRVRNVSSHLGRRGATVTLTPAARRAHGASQSRRYMVKIAKGRPTRWRVANQPATMALRISASGLCGRPGPIARRVVVLKAA